MELENQIHLQENILKPFYERASAAEDRLARLEAAVGSKKDTGTEELLTTIGKLQSKLDEANTQIGKRDAEVAKLQYRILHLVRALRQNDLKLEEMSGHDSSSTADAISKLKI